MGTRSPWQLLGWNHLAKTNQWVALDQPGWPLRRVQDPPQGSSVPGGRFLSGGFTRATLPRGTQAPAPSYCSFSLIFRVLQL